MENLKETDPELFEAINNELSRQRVNLELIALPASLSAGKCQSVWLNSPVVDMSEKYVTRFWLVPGQEQA